MHRFVTILGVSALAVFALAVGVARGQETDRTPLEPPRDVLAMVKERGYLTCGVNEGLAGFALKGADDEWRGLDVDFCRAVAAAVLGDNQAVRFTPLSQTERYRALRAGDVDILARNTTWTMGREAQLGILFAGVNYYDGLSFLVSKRLYVETVKELAGAQVCFLRQTTTETRLKDYNAKQRIKFTLRPFDSIDEMRAAYEDPRGGCDAWASDQSQLAARRLELKVPDDHVVLEEVISKEPLGPAVAAGDTRWFTIVRWTLMALIQAEELQITQANVGARSGNEAEDPEVRLLLGVGDPGDIDGDGLSDGDLGAALGLPPDWAARAIAAVGNYGEIYERNVGELSDLELKRKLNALWTDGGLMYAPPIR